MRTLTLILLALSIGAISASAQIGKGKIISETSLNLSLENLSTIFPESDGSTILITTLPGSEKNRIFNIEERIGYSVSDRFVLGIGLGYTRLTNIKRTVSGLLISVRNTVNGTSVEQYVIESYFSKERATSIRPSLYVSYFIPLSKRFQLISRFDLEQERTTYDVIANDGIIEDHLSLADHYGVLTQKYLTYALSASLFFELSKSIGIQAKVFNTSFRHKYASENIWQEEQRFNITMNPLNWEYGFVFIFGNKNLSE